MTEISWEEYFDSVFKRGVTVTTGKQKGFERVRLLFDWYCIGVEAGEARSLLREIGRE